MHKLYVFERNSGYSVQCVCHCDCVTVYMLVDAMRLVHEFAV
jgi:hypothetical protein